MTVHDTFLRFQILCLRCAMRNHRLLSVCSSHHYNTVKQSSLEQKIHSGERSEFQNPQGKPLVHCYKTLFPWKSREEFTTDLYSNIVFNKDGLIALNKPYGVPIYRRREVEDDSPKIVKQTASLPTTGESPYSVEDALPELQLKLALPSLRIVKTTERYTSGIVLLAATEGVASKVQRTYRHAKTLQHPHLIYWAVTAGWPAKLEEAEKVGIKLVEIGEKDYKQPIILTDYSKNDVKRGLVRPIRVEYRAVRINKFLSSSLLEIGTTSVKWHFLRVYAAHKAVSILGDTLYSSRVRKIFGQPINISPHNDAAYDLQPLPKPMCEKLHISDVKGHEAVPTMLHLQTVLLLKYFKKSDLVISAPLPYHFLWTLGQLGLQ